MLKKKKLSIFCYITLDAIDGRFVLFVLFYTFSESFFFPDGFAKYIQPIGGNVPPAALGPENPDTQCRFYERLTKVSSNLERFPRFICETSLRQTRCHVLHVPKGPFVPAAARTPPTYPSRSATA